MKWALGGVTLIAVIAITAAVSIALTKGSGGGGNGTPTASASPSATASGTASNGNGEIASANDTGPVNIITEDPSCTGWTPINNALAQSERNGWENRDRARAATDWTPEQRTQYNEVARAMKVAADQTVPLAKLTPHRAMRELFEQFIAYARAYSDAVPNYKPDDNYLAGVVGATSSALVSTCAAISYGSAQAQAPSVGTPAPPSNAVVVGDPNSPEKFLPVPDSTCGDWQKLIQKFGTDTPEWQALDPNIPSSGWSPEQHAIIESVIPVMRKLADDIENLGRSSANATLQDFAIMSAQYRRAYAQALPSYSSADSYLSGAAAHLTSAIIDGCKAVGG